MRRLLNPVGFLAGVVFLVAAVWVYSAVRSTYELERRGASDLALAADRLEGTLVGYRQLAVTLASDPRMIAGTSSKTEIEDILRRATDVSGALDFVLLERDRRYVAGASDRGPHTWIDRSFIDRALNGALGRDVIVSNEFGRRAFVYAAPVFAPSGPVARVLVAVLDLEAIEADFRGSNPAIFMTDGSGFIFFSNRSELVLRDRGSPGKDDASGFVDHWPFSLFGFDLWRVSAGRYLPSLALHLEQDLPVIGMFAEALIDLRPAISSAWLQSMVAGAVCLLLGWVIFLVANQRRILAQANEALETRVAERTSELSDVNTALRVEIAEREEAERALKQAQDDLVQAGKLSALGKMSAGISHELNQPLMAIQSFSDNAAAFIERGDVETASGNLRKVSDLARRMARIIQNFRAFARQEKDTALRVDLVQAVKRAVELAERRIEKHGVALTLELPDRPIWVQGGDVRLQQVVLNLLSNAIDAMVATERREISVVVMTGAPAVLTVSDTGPGIAEPEKVFEPFYSTREIGEAEGVGLGLSISYGLVQSFGGMIRGHNAPDGGAVFTVELQPWTEETAA